VKLIGAWLGVDHATTLRLLTGDEWECLAVEAMCRKAVWR
jgi:hypothetical protein